MDIECNNVQSDVVAHIQSVDKNQHFIVGLDTEASPVIVAERLIQVALELERTFGGDWVIQAFDSRKPTTDSQEAGQILHDYNKSRLDAQAAESKQAIMHSPATRLQ